MGIFISDLVLQILSYVVQTEREYIKKRQAEGIAAAKANGVKFGVRKKPRPEGFDEAKERWQKGEISVRDASRILGMPPSTFHKYCMEDKLNDCPIK